VLQRLAQRVSGHRDQKQRLFAGEIEPRRLLHLRAGREVDVAIADVDRRAGEDALRLGLAPE